ncbi:MAG TPA: error-prone DNA polymerase, partial [Bryobacteraceae bacterium]|nr:error-prone DNA polymerase [Bryobacteraceae bacterium]
RALGFRRSEQRMRDVETKLRDGMASNGIGPAAQEEIIKSITSFALYGFPESHAASFALIAYASAYLKCRYLAAFLTAMLNNQPMGFYAPATLVKDAQHHGLHFRPVDVQRSEWLCTVEPDKSVRLGFNYIKGLRKDAAEAITRTRAGQPFSSIQDFVDRVPELHKDEVRMLAEAGALNFITGVDRRGALWEAELAMRPAGPLFDASIHGPRQSAPLARMTASERLSADFRRTHLTIGPHPMSFHRARLNQLGIVPANNLKAMRNGVLVKTAGAVICRQRPGTAKGLVFLSMEDETGVSNVVIMPDKFAEYRTTVVGNGYLVIEGELQNIDGVVSVKADHVMGLHIAEQDVPSHNFH